MSSAIVFLFVKWPEITWHTIAPYLHSSVKTVCHTVSLLTLLLDGEKTENSLQSAAHALKSIFWKVGFLFSFFSFPLTVLDLPQWLRKIQEMCQCMDPAGLQIPRLSKH